MRIGAAHEDSARGGATRQQRRLLRVESQACAACAEAEVNGDIGRVGLHDAARGVPCEDVADVMLEQSAAAGAGCDCDHSASAVPRDADDRQGWRLLLRLVARYSGQSPRRLRLQHLS